MNLGERIAQVRGKISRKVFAKSLGIHPQTLYLYEKGRRNANISIINKICDDHSISVEWLTKGTGSMNKSKEASSAPRDEPAAHHEVPSPSARGVPLPRRVPP